MISNISTVHENMIIIKNMKADLPVDWDSKPVKVLVSSNFNEIALDKTKEIFIFFLFYILFYVSLITYRNKFKSDE